MDERTKSGIECTDNRILFSLGVGERAQKAKAHVLHVDYLGQRLMRLGERRRVCPLQHNRMWKALRLKLTESSKEMQIPLSD